MSRHTAVFMTRSPAIGIAWPRMSPDEQEYLVGMHTHYLNGFRNIKATGQPEGIAAATHDLVDELVDQLKAADHQAAGIKCRRGCSHCCHTYVTITPQEALLLHRFARELGLEVDRDKLARQAAHDAMDWYTQPEGDTGCVFLDPTGSCAVYEHRPNSCRKYFAISDPAGCEVKADPGGKVLNWVSMKAEIVASAALMAFECGSMPAMLLKHVPLEE